MIQDTDVMVGPNGEKFKYSILKAHAASSMKMVQQNFLKNLQPEKKAEFYYHVYEILDKQTLAEKKDPFIRAGISPYTFMTEPINLGNFITSHGEIFSRLHRALMEAMITFDLEGK